MKKIYILLLTLGFWHISAMEKDEVAVQKLVIDEKKEHTPQNAAENDEEIVIIWDLGGVHWKLSKAWYGMQTARNIGVGTVLSSLIFDRKAPSGTFFFDVLRAFPLEREKNFKCTYSDSGVELPYVLCAQQAGKISNKEILQMLPGVLQDLRNKNVLVSQRHVDMAQRGIETIVNPEVNASSNSPIPEGIALVNRIAELKKQGRKIKQVVLSNWEPESFALLRSRYPEKFADFDDLFISGEIKTIKPNEAAFAAVINKYGPNKRKYIFIDDQKENIAAAKAFGIEKSILFTGDFYDLEKQLHGFGVFGKMPDQPVFTRGVKIASGLALLGAVLLWLS